MGFAVPAAVGARLARGQGRPVVLVGDGSFQMTGTDLSTAVAQGLDPIVLVLDNHGYGAERAIVDGPFNDVAPWDYTAVAAALGAEGRRVTNPEGLDRALGEARRGRGRAWVLWLDLDPHDAPRALRPSVRASSTSCTPPTDPGRRPSRVAGRRAPGCACRGSAVVGSTRSRWSPNGG